MQSISMTSFVCFCTLYYILILICTSLICRQWLDKQLPVMTASICSEITLTTLGSGEKLVEKNGRPCQSCTFCVTLRSSLGSSHPMQEIQAEATTIAYNCNVFRETSITLEVCYKQSMKNCSWFFYFFCQINIQLFEQAARKLHGSKEGLRADDRYVRNVLTTHCNEEEHINHLTIVAARFAGWQSQEQVLILDDISWPRVQQLVRMHNQHRLPWGVNPSSILRQVKTSLLLFILDFSRGCNPKRTAFYIAARVAIQLYILTRLRRFLWALQRFSLFFDGEGVLSWIIRSAKWKLHSATWYGLHDIWGPHSETGHKIMVAEPTSMSLTMQSGQFARLHTPIPLFLQSFRCQPAQLGKVQEMPRCPFEIHFISVYDVHNDFIMFVSRNTLECAF